MAEPPAPMPYGPDFLGVGVSRAGTTSVNAVLARHPEVWTPPVKEMSYFDKMRGSQRPIRTRRLHRRLFRRTLKWVATGRCSPRDIGWHLRYLAGPGDDAWYAHLFAPRRAAAMGEISPNYCMIDDALIQALAGYWPNLKIVFFLREPMARIWSAVKHQAGGARKLARLDAATVEARALAKAREGKNDYAWLLARWQAVFPRQQIFVGFHDDLVAEPAPFYRKLFAFLGVAPPSPHLLARAGAIHLNTTSGQRRNQTGTGGNGPPPWLAAMLAAELSPAIDRFAAQFPHPGQAWQARRDAALAAG